MNSITSIAVAPLTKKKKEKKNRVARLGDYLDTIEITTVPKIFLRCKREGRKSVCVCVYKVTGEGKKERMHGTR